MRKRFVVVVVGLFSLVSLCYAQVEIIDSGAKEVEQNYSGSKFTKNCRTISVENQGPVNYYFRYYYALGTDLVRGTKPLPFGFPYIGDSSVSTTGLGLGGGGWYKNGFLGIKINKKGLTRIVAKEIKVVEQGKRGVVEVLWEPEWAEIKARFIFLPKDDKVYTEITLAPNVEVESLELLLVCFPGHVGTLSKKPLGRWISTAKRSIQLTGMEQSIFLTPNEEPWIFYFDAQANRMGTCAVMYLPEEVKEVKMLKGSSPRTMLTLSPEIRKIHLLFWNFPDSYKKPEDAYQYLKENGEGLLKKLKNFQF